MTRVGLGRRLAWHARLALGASRAAMAGGAMGGLALRLALPVEETWVASAVAGGAATVAFLLVLLSHAAGAPSPPAAKGMDSSVALESLRTLEQFAQAFARAALLLAAFAAGLWAGGLLGLGRA